MKELTALDIFYLVKEFQILKDSKVDQIFQPSSNVLIRIHSPNTGKKIIHINKNFIFLTDFKGDQPINPKQFCMSLRKHIKNARIRSIEQVSFERVIKFEIENRDQKMFLYVELFSKGNSILTDESNKIINSLHKDQLKNIITGQIYNPPIKDYELNNLNLSKFKEMLRESDKSLVKTLAIDLGLGGDYSEFVLEGFDKDSISKEMKVKDMESLFKKISSLIKHDVKPSLLNERIVPFETDNKLKFETFSEAISDMLTEELKEEEQKTIMKPFNDKKSKVEKIVKMQTEAVKKLENNAEEAKLKGELIYNNYQIVEDIIKQINEAKKKLTWKEIKDKLKGHKIIKNIDEKNMTVEVELK
ncbi:NFACT family protein [Candidatus Woesearchaeota archaeon]|nr:NFACT family protein [Candidatus Woesearchaeota archaeon]